MSDQGLESLLEGWGLKIFHEFNPRFVFAARSQVTAAKAAQQPLVLVPGEPSGPVVKTKVPGPKSKELTEELGHIQVCCKFSIILYPLVSLNFCFSKIFVAS